MRGSPVVSHPSRIPRFGARCWLRWVRRSDLGWSPLPPSSLSSSPAKNRVGGDWPSRKKAQGWCGPQPKARTRPCAPWRPGTGGYGRGISDEGGERRKPGQRPGERRTHGRAASARACRRHAWLEVNKRAARIGTMRRPIRRCLVGGIDGRQACAAGIGASQSPGEPRPRAQRARW